MSTSSDTGTRIARNAVARSAGEIVGKLASLAFFVTMARELGSHGFGAFMFALALTGALLLGAGFGTDELTARAVAGDPGAAGPMTADVAAVKVVLSVALVAVAVLAAVVGGFPRTTVLAVGIVGAGAAIEVLARTWCAVFQGLERLVLVSWTLIVQRVSTAAVGILALHLGAGLVTVSVVFAAGALLGLATAEVALRRLIGPRPAPRPGRWPGLVRAGLPFGTATLLFVVLLRIDVTVLSFLAPADQVGYYAAAYRLVESCQFVTWAMTAAILPWLVRAPAVANGPLARAYGLAVKGVMAVLTPLGVGFVVFARPLVQVLYGPQFGPAVVPLQLLGVTCVLYGVQNVAITVAVARNRPRPVAVIVSCAVVLSLVLNVVTIPRFGAAGAAGSALLCSLALAIALTLHERRRVGRIHVVRSCAGPVVAGLAMAAVGLAVPLPLAAHVLVTAAAYVLGLAAVEGLCCRDDLALFRRALVPRLFRRGVQRVA